MDQICKIHEVARLQVTTSEYAENNIRRILRTMVLGKSKHQAAFLAVCALEHSWAFFPILGQLGGFPWEISSQLGLSVTVSCSYCVTARGTFLGCIL